VANTTACETPRLSTYAQRHSFLEASPNAHKHVDMTILSRCYLHVHAKTHFRVESHPIVKGGLCDCVRSCGRRRTCAVLVTCFVICTSFASHIACHSWRSGSCPCFEYRIVCDFLCVIWLECRHCRNSARIRKKDQYPFVAFCGLPQSFAIQRQCLSCWLWLVRGYQSWCLLILCWNCVASSTASSCEVLLDILQSTP
jgi:hypothetical protein